MKSILMILILTSGTFAHAHGSPAQQANDAIKVATQLFETQPREVRKKFKAISAEMTGHEEFAVVILLNDNVTKFEFACKENEDVTPVIWECQ